MGVMPSEGGSPTSPGEETSLEISALKERLTADIARHATKLQQDAKAELNTRYAQALSKAHTDLIQAITNYKEGLENIRSSSETDDQKERIKRMASQNLEDAFNKIISEMKTNFPRFC